MFYSKINYFVWLSTLICCLSNVIIAQPTKKLSEKYTYKETPVNLPPPTLPESLPQETHHLSDSILIKVKEKNYKSGFLCALRITDPILTGKVNEYEISITRTKETEAGYIIFEEGKFIESQRKINTWTATIAINGAEMQFPMLWENEEFGGKMPKELWGKFTKKTKVTMHNDVPDSWGLHQTIEHSQQIVSKLQKIFGQRAPQELIDWLETPKSNS